MPLYELHKRAFNTVFRGMNQECLRKEAHVFWQDCFSKFSLASIHEELQVLKQKGYYCALLSSSPQFFLEEMPPLPVDYLQGSTYDLDEKGNFCFLNDIMDGKLKADTLRSLKKQFGELDTVAYSDSIVDLALLAQVKKVIAVNPDSVLRRLCLLKGWEIRKIEKKEKKDECPKAIHP